MRENDDVAAAACSGFPSSTDGQVGRQAERGLERAGAQAENGKCTDVCIDMCVGLDRQRIRSANPPFISYDDTLVMAKKIVMATH